MTLQLNPSLSNIKLWVKSTNISKQEPSALPKNNTKLY